MSTALEIGIFGFFPGLTDPGQIQNAAMVCLFSAAIPSILTFIAGFGRNLLQREQSQ
jgi:hypothetical protein